MGGAKARPRVSIIAASVVLLATGLATVGPSALAPTAAGAAAPSSLAIAAGDRDSCMLRPAGTVKCWGYNAYGEVGDGTTTNQLIAIPVAGLTGVSAVAAGSTHTCALLVAGTVQCWGQNASGELGDGTTTDRLAPTTVPGLTNVNAIAAGGFDTCALLAVGTVKCWGLNTYGELGDGTTTNRFVPTTIPGLSGVSAITTGRWQTCALLADQTVKCWGHNLYGELGDGSSADRLVPTAVPGLGTVRSVVAGRYETCALLGAQTVKCWGLNTSGQLGDGTTTNRLAPTAIPGLSNVSAVEVGGHHACALLASGTVKCWGDNSVGQLGDGTNTDRLAPTAVQGLAEIGAIATGANHTCALSTVVVVAVTMTCWGNNAHGEVGDGTTTNRPLPTTAIPVPKTVPTMLAHLQLVNYYPHDHGWTLMWSSFDPAEINSDFAAMHAMGANSVRVIIQAYAVGFPQPTPTGLSEVAQVVALAAANGLTAQLTLFDWFGDWPNIAGSTTWAKAILTPFKNDPRVSFVELKNEVIVTDPGEMQWAQTMLPIVKADAGTLPVTISLPGNAPSNALSIMKTTFGSALDFYDVHYYGGSGAVGSRIANDKATVAPSPLYIGESGFSTGSGGSPSNASLEAQQATFFTNLNAATAANGIGLASPWAWQDFDDGSLTWVGSTSGEYHFGLLRADGTPKPALAVERNAFAG